MTPKPSHCAACGRRLTQAHTGRPRLYCNRRCAEAIYQENRTDASQPIYELWDRYAEQRREAEE